MIYELRMLLAEYLLRLVMFIIPKSGEKGMLLISYIQDYAREAIKLMERPR